MDLTAEDRLRAQALWLALETFPDEGLRQLADGDEEPIRALRAYATAILRRRRMAGSADSN